MSKKGSFVLASAGLGVCAIFLFIQGVSHPSGATSTTPVNPIVHWQLVNGNSFENGRNFDLPALEEYKDFLYAGTNNLLETEIWRSVDGLSWTGVMTNDGVHTHSPYIGALTLDFTVFDGYLYASTLYRAQGGAIWRSPDGLSWTPVITRDQDLYQVFSPLQVYYDNLYVIANTTDNITQTAEVWQTTDGLSWYASLLEDFDAYSFSVFNGHLYAGGRDRLNQNSALWYTDGITWTQALHDMGAPLTSTIISLAEFRGELYAARLNKGFTPPYLDLWYTQDGVDWTEIETATQAINSQAGTLMASSALFVFDGHLFLFTCDLSTGGDVWRTSDGIYWEQVGFDGWGDPNTRGANGRNSIVDFQGGMFVGATSLGPSSRLWLYLPETVFLPQVSK
jgi:hypothetical protein